MLVISMFLLFITVLLIREHAHERERKDLYNRLMSKDIEEYKTFTGSLPSRNRGEGNFLKKQLKNAYSTQDEQ